MGRTDPLGRKHRHWSKAVPRSPTASAVGECHRHALYARLRVDRHRRQKKRLKKKTRCPIIGRHIGANYPSGLYSPAFSPFRYPVIGEGIVKGEDKLSSIPELLANTRSTRFFLPVMFPPRDLMWRLYLRKSVRSSEIGIESPRDCVR
jgi:hypothetical protein